ncbi:MAG: hypothetical protein ABI443_03275 [Chthoniobacterales bacterium]
MKNEVSAGEVVAQDELEMVIPAIQSPEDAEKVSLLLRAIRGVDTLVVSSQIVWLAYRPDLTCLKNIFETLRNSNFYPSDALENGHLVTC